MGGTHGDGAPICFDFADPHGIIVGRDGEVFTADTGLHVVRRWTKDPNTKALDHAALRRRAITSGEAEAEDGERGVFGTWRAYGWQDPLPDGENGS